LVSKVIDNHTLYYSCTCLLQTCQAILDQYAFRYHKVDLRTITLGVPPQEVLTRDSVTISVDAVVYYRVSNSTMSKTSVENAHHSTSLLSQTILTSVLGTKNLHEILSDRDSISGSVQLLLDEATEPWGIKVERLEIKDARLPVQLQRAMAAEAEAAREARAKAIQASGEAKAAKNLRAAGEVIKTSSALHLRYMQALNSISRENNHTVIFPLPCDLLDSGAQAAAGKDVPTLKSRETVDIELEA